MVTFFSSANRYILTSFSVFSASKLFLMLDLTKSYVEKYTELAGHAHKLDVKLHRLWEWLLCLLCACTSLEWTRMHVFGVILTLEWTN